MRSYRRRWGWPLLAGVACRDVTPPEVARATPMAAQAPYALWWAATEACSGLRGDLSAVRWAVGDSALLAEQNIGGEYYAPTRQIVLAPNLVLNGRLVRHEMLHALLGPGYTGANPHPAAYFGARCGGTVVCAGPCRAEVAADAPAPSGAPPVRPDDLVVTAQVVVPPAGTAAAGGAFAIVVTARTPTGVAGWVPRSANATAPETPDFGYTATGPLFPDVPLGSVHAAPGARTYFAAGEVKRFVFDVQAGEFLPGAYTLRGSFAGAASAPSTVTLPP